jgi:putative phosphoribosyl transferase
MKIPIEEIHLEGDLYIPKEPKGLVLFSHGSGSSRLSPRNQFVAKFLNDNRFATLLVDLLTPKEESLDQITSELRFNIGLLAERLLGVCHWLIRESTTKLLPLGVFGASTGAAAALIAAAKIGPIVKAVVSRGGRPDLAMNYLSKVESPTLLIVGGFDGTVIEMNQRAYLELTCEKKLEIVPRATHLFEEQGALEAVSRLAAGWFAGHLIKKKPSYV